MKLMALAMDVRVGNPLRKLVLLKLCDNANDKGECWPSIQHIADQCEVSRRSVINHLQALVDIGFVRVVNRARNGEKISNLYVIDLTPKPQINQLESSAGDALGGSARDALGSAGDALGSAGAALGGSAGAAHRTSHSLEPVTEPKKNYVKKSFQGERVPAVVPREKPPESSSRGTRLPPDWVLPDEWRADALAVDQRLASALDSIAAKFRDYWISTPGARGVKLNWRATWRNWVRRDAERLPPQRPPSGAAVAVFPGGGGGGCATRFGPAGDLRSRSLEQDLTDRSWAGRQNRGG